MGDPNSFFEAVLTRAQGPMNVRFVVQPLVALFFAFRDGRRDVREGRPPYFWALFNDPGSRPELLRSGWKGIGKVFLIAVLFDLVFQFIAFHSLHPLGSLNAGVILAILPYLLLRGPLNRFLRRVRKGEKP